MKRISAFLLALLVVFTILPSVAFAASYRYATEPVMFRTGPGTRYAIIAELQTGEQVEYLGRPGNWTKARRNGQTGYVFTKYLSSNPVTSGTYLYASEPVNMRTGASTRYAIITELQTGERVEYLGKSGNWTKVNWRGQTGYVFTKYLSSASNNSSAPSLAVGTLATATTSGVNVRSGPGTSYRSLGKVKKGEVLPVVDKSGDWLKIEWNGTNAYVHSRYFKWEPMGQSVSMADALQRSGYFKTNASVYLGTFMDSADVLNIRVSRGANTTKITNDLTALLKGTKGSFRVVASSLPSGVNEEYIKELMDTISYRHTRLSANDRKRIELSAMYYDVAKDQFIVEIVKLNDEKVRYFEQYIMSWESISFRSVDSLAVPMT